MNIYRGGQTVKRGTYWDPDRAGRIVVNDEGVLPGDRNETYFKLPEGYLLIPVLVIGLALSTAFPYGMGFMLFISLVALGGACYAAGAASVRILKEMLGRTAAFGYSPTTAYMTGRKKKN